MTELTLRYRTYKFGIPMVFLGEDDEIKFSVFQSLKGKSLFKSFLTFTIKDSGDNVLVALISETSYSYSITTNDEQLGVMECTVSGRRTVFELTIGKVSYCLSGTSRIISGFFFSRGHEYVITKNNLEISRIIENTSWKDFGMGIEKYKVDISEPGEITAVLCLSTALAQSVHIRLWQNSGL